MSWEHHANPVNFNSSIVMGCSHAHWVTPTISWKLQVQTGWGSSCLRCIMTPCIQWPYWVHVFGIMCLKSQTGTPFCFIDHCSASKRNKYGNAACSSMQQQQRPETAHTFDSSPSCWHQAPRLTWAGMASGAPWPVAILQMSAIWHLLAMQTHNDPSLVAKAMCGTLSSIKWSCWQNLDRGGLEQESRHHWHRTFKRRHAF